MGAIFLFHSVHFSIFSIRALVVFVVVVIVDLPLPSCVCVCRGCRLRRVCLGPFPPCFRLMTLFFFWRCQAFFSASHLHRLFGQAVLSAQLHPLRFLQTKNNKNVLRLFSRKKKKKRKRKGHERKRNDNLIQLLDVLPVFHLKLGLREPEQACGNFPKVINPCKQEGDDNDERGERGFFFTPKSDEMKRERVLLQARTPYANETTFPWAATVGFSTRCSSFASIT